MPLQKLQFRPGIVRDLTSLAAEGGWYACDKMRFRMGFPEKIGGWGRVSSAAFQGICRTLSCWASLSGAVYTGVGTNAKFYIETAGEYNDITPLRYSSVVAANAYTTSNLSAVVQVNDVAHGALTGDYVTVSGSVAAVGGIPAATFNGNFQVTVLTADAYQITVGTAATSGATGGNGNLAYEHYASTETGAATQAWGSGTWGSGPWGGGGAIQMLRIWNQVPYGEDLVFGARGGALYFWDASGGLAARGVLVSSLVGASSVPVLHNGIHLDAASRILVLLGANGYGGVVLDPMLVRWSAADSTVEWAPAITNQAGEYRLTEGSQIIAHAQTRSETLILTDSSAFSMQYIGPPFVFSFAQLSSNCSIAGPNAIVAVNNTVYWMGQNTFYVYDGRVQTLPCPLLNEVFDNINVSQSFQFFAGSNASFNEVWWFYCTAGALGPDRYVVYNYADKIWYYGTLERSAWLDTALRDGVIGATYVNNLVQHESGTDDLSTATSMPISAFIESADFDIGDGHNYAFIDKAVPDITFVGSSAVAPNVNLSVRARNNPGSAYLASGEPSVAQTATVPVEQFTELVYIRVRGRVMSLRIASTAVGVQWQLGTPRINVRPDGRRA